jgi:hypothetical protein
MQVENPAIFMQAIPLSLNKLHLFSTTQPRFILIQIVAFTRVLHVSAFVRFCIDMPDMALEQAETRSIPVKAIF